MTHDAVAMKLSSLHYFCDIQ